MLKNWIIVVYFVFKLALVDAVSSWRSVSTHSYGVTL